MSSEYFDTLELYLEGRLRQFKHRLADTSQLNLHERSLLKVRPLLAQKKWSQTVAILGSINPVSSLLRAEKEKLLATAFCYLNQWEKSLTHNQNALIYYSEINYQKGQFYALYNLSVDAAKLNLADYSFECIKKAQKLASHRREEILIYRAQACHYSHLMDFDSAIRDLKVVEANLETQTSIDQNTFFTVAAEIYFKADQWPQALQYLSRLKNKKRNREYGRSLFNYTLLSLLLVKNYRLDSKIPVEIVNQPEYQLKWKIIVAAQSGAESQVNQLWADLCKALPRVYIKDFKNYLTSDENSIFYTFLIKILNSESDNLAVRSFDRNDMGKLTVKMTCLLNSLSDSKLPLRKEYLIEKVWNATYKPDFDSRFYKLIERTNKRLKSFRITNSSGAYSLSR